MCVVYIYFSFDKVEKQNKIAQILSVQILTRLRQSRRNKVHLERGKMRTYAICIILCVWLLPANNITDGKRILGIVMAPWYSHQIVFRSLFMALNKRGHELVVATSNPMRDPTLKNYTEIELSSVYEIIFSRFTDETQAISLSVLESSKQGIKVSNKLCAALFDEPEFAKLYGRDNNETFDAVIVELLGGPALCAVAHRFNASLIGVMSVGLHTYHRYLFGGPIASSHPSNWELVVGEDPPSIWQKLWNFIETWRYIYFWMDTITTVQQEIVKKHFGNDMPNIIDIARNMSILLINENPAYSYVKPEQPNVMFFSGFHINKTPPPLPRDLRRFLDDATEGFIYVSFGTTAKWSILPKETLENFVEVFSKLPYKIVLKFEPDEWSGRKLDNVFISKWFPQQGVLAHPNIKLYIYQGGLQSTEEAVYYAVPLLGIPIMFDQHIRLQRLASLGIAIHLKFNKLTRENLDAAIRLILADKSYKEKMIRISSIVKDQPYDNMENTIWWIEYAMKHKERMHYHRFSEMDKPWYQRYDMDIIALLATTIFVIACTTPLIILWILRFIFRQFCKIFNFQVSQNMIE